ncbi:MAG: DEAD/DEAH box helicase family protein [Desulfovibrio sp.]|nr:DEAD/DEAH box helicase family protein [Desulfovibrio sp.]
MTLFDMMVDQIEELRAEKLEDDKREQPKQDQNIPPYVRLGLNSKGMTVYALKDGSRMISRDPKIMRTVDGDKNSPENLYGKKEWEFLTIEEVAAFTKAERLSANNNAQPPLEVQHGSRQTNSLAGNRQNRSQTRNHPRSSDARVHQVSLFDLGSMGAEQPGHAESLGRAGGNLPPDTAGSATDEGTPGIVQRHGLGDEPSRDERLGDFGTVRDRYRVENYRISPEGRLGFGGAKAKFAENIAAIRLLQELQAQRAKVASPEEKKVLVRYVGWGGIPQAFDPQNDKWEKEYRELQSLLSPEDYAKARRSTQDAHYTSETVIRGIYQGLGRIGLLKGGTPHILEPSAGIGNFIGLCPEELNSRFLAVELDPTTSAIAQYLYPKARHVNNGFQNAELFAPCFDVVVGNPPFGNQSLYDPHFPELRSFSIHNYFLAKSIGLLREGGVAAFVVSRFFLDAADPTAREHIAKNADFLGAVRLPETAFRQNALTDVTTDIVFFQKNSGEKRKSQDWVHTTEIEFDDLKEGGRKSAVINNFFAQRPDQIIGKMVFSGGMYQDALNCVADASLDLGQEIEKRLGLLPEVYVPQAEARVDAPAAGRDEEFISSSYFQSLKTDAFCVEPQSRKIIFKCFDGVGQATYDFVPVKNDMARQRLASMIQIRDSLRELLNAEKTDAEEGHIEKLRHQLNIHYDSHVRRYGHLNSQTNRALMRDDPEHSLLESLEVKYDKGISPDTAKRQGRAARPASARKAAIFQQRVLKPSQAVEHAATAKDALVIALRETGKVDFARMDQLLGRPAESIRKELQDAGLIFQNPVGEEWEIRDKYLTGNVREKLRIAREAAAKGDEKWQVNVEALAKAMPPEIEAVDIGIKFGSTWVPGEIFSDFINERISDRGYNTISYIPVLGRWEAKINLYDPSSNTDIWGIPEYPANEILESLLTNKAIKVEKDTGQDDERGNPIKVVDQELTAAAMAKADAIRQEFLDWVWTDDARRDMLAKLYNERFNTHVPPHYDGAHIELVNASSSVTLRPHQKDVVWRSIQEGTCLYDHVVGAGKTFACAAAIMESKRMGFLQKPMVVVPNHLLFQWRDDFYRLYPDANILVADKTDFTKQNRERFFGRIATGEWDAVIVAHSSFRKIDMPRDMQEEILQEQINAVIDAIREGKENNGARATIKQLEKQKEKMEARYDKLLAGTGPKDRSVDFADLGVDGLFVDESHEFKNLSYATTMNVSGLGNITGSAKALDLFIKCRYLQKKHNGRGVYFMTGTPISNTIAEVYTLQRYMQYEELQGKNIEHFDAWASTFGQVTSGWELDSTGVNYKLKSRFASFQNVPELLAMYRSFADVVTRNDLDEHTKQIGERPMTPPVLDGKPFNHVVDRSENQAEYMQSIIHRMENLPPDPRKDNPLVITNDARKAGLDYRLIDPGAEDHPGSKINAAVERIYAIWRDTAADSGTQLVFCDLSTPKGAAKPSGRQTERFPAFDFAEEPASADMSDAELMEESDKDGEDATTEPNMDEFVAITSKFSVYDDMRQKLMDRGIPADEIAFIHDANTDIRKAKLFSDVQTGRVRILLGSTFKMGAGMNVQERLVAAHHLDAPWRPSDLEQRNGRIIRQGNMLYERDPDNFNVGIYYYATKQTYDARMWQTIEYKAAAIEQFRKGDLLQRVIDDVQSEAANAAEMKAAASGNPLILMQVKLASDLRKLEALHSQHQRSQHRLKDRLKWLSSAQDRLVAANTLHAENLKRRDAGTRTVIEKGKERIRSEIVVDGRTIRDDEAIKESLRTCVNEVMKFSSKKAAFGSYRGFEIAVLRSMRDDGFRFMLKGSGDQEFQPDNLVYSFDEKFSLSGFFQRLDNFLDKGLEQAFETYKTNVSRELAELETVKAALGQEFPQKDELALTRENHGAVMRELQRMQNEPGYVSSWEPKAELHQTVSQSPDAASTSQDDLAEESLRMDTKKQEDTLNQVGAITPEISIRTGIPVGNIILERHAAEHIESQHGEQIRNVGYANVNEFIQFVLANVDAVYLGNKPNRIAFVTRVRRPSGQIIAGIEFEQQGRHYTVITAQPIRSDFYKNKKPLWEVAQSNHFPEEIPGAVSGQSGSGLNLAQYANNVNPFFQQKQSSDYRTELARLAMSVLPQNQWVDEVREAWQKPYLERIAAANESPELIEKYLQFARYDATPEGQTELRGMRQALKNVVRGIELPLTRENELVSAAMSDIRISPDRQVALKSALKKFNEQAMQSALNL